MDLMKALTSQYMKPELPQMNVGDTVRVHVKIKEGSRERIQVFEGIIIAKKHGGIEESITVRRISYGVGCEKVFPVHAPNVVNVETVRHGKVRRAKLYYLRDRLGKAAKSKEKVGCKQKRDAIWRLFFAYMGYAALTNRIRKCCLSAIIKIACGVVKFQMAKL